MNFKTAFWAQFKYSLVRIVLVLGLVGLLAGMYVAYLADDYHTRVVDPNEAPPGVDVHPGLNTAPVPCDWCTQETHAPVVSASKSVSPSASPSAVPSPQPVPSP